MNRSRNRILWIIPLAVLAVVYLAGGLGAVSANFVDAETSTGNRLIISNWWNQTTKAHFDAGVKTNVDTATSSGNVLLSKVYTLVTSNDTIVTQSNTTFVLKKTLTINKTSTSYDSIQIVSQLRRTTASGIAYEEIRIGTTVLAAHNTTNTAYQTYTDTINFSSYANGTYNINLYLRASGPTITAANQNYRISNYPYVTGTLASAVYNSTMSSAAWNKLYWVETLPSGTNITFEVRASNTSFAKADATPTWVSLGTGDSPQTLSVTGQYFQWRATLAPSSDGASTPTLSDITAYYPSTT